MSGRFTEEVEYLRKAMADDAIVLMLRSITLRHPLPPRDVTWRDAVVLTAMLRQDFLLYIVAVPAVWVGKIVVWDIEHIPDNSPWIIVPICLMLICLAFWVREIVSTKSCLRTEALDTRAVESVEINWNSPKGYEPAGTFREARGQWRLNDGRVVDFSIDREWAMWLRPEIKLVIIAFRDLAVPLDLRM